MRWSPWVYRVSCSFLLWADICFSHSLVCFVYRFQRSCNASVNMKMKALFSVVLAMATALVSSTDVNLLGHRKLSLSSPEKAPRRKQGNPLPANDLPFKPGTTSRLRGLPPKFKRALQGTDVNAGEDALAEVSIDINPRDPDNLVIVGHDSTLETMNTFYSKDGGETWDPVTLGDAEDELTSVFRFDPSMVFASDGTVYIGYGASCEYWRSRGSYCRCVPKHRRR